MVAYEFSTEVTQNRTLTIPVTTAPALAAGTQVRVILLVQESAPQNSQSNGHQKSVEVQASSLQQLIFAIKQMPRNPALIQADNGLLGQHLAELEQEIDPTLPTAEWLRDWDQVEAEMKRESLAREIRLLQEFSR